MAKRRPDSNRRDLATWLMLLLPGFMFAGMLAPAAVRVKPKTEALEEIGEISFRNFKPRRPIQFSLPQGASSESALEPVFAGARYVVEQAKQVVEIDFNADQGGVQIVLNEDSVESYVAETLFEVSAEQPQQQLVVDLSPLWDPSVFDVIPDLIDRRGYGQWDDFHGTGLLFTSDGATPGNIIPEPATGGLLAIGLAALARRRRN